LQQIIDLQVRRLPSIKDGLDDLRRHRVNRNTRLT
jgi:hypothetical protein